MSVLSRIYRKGVISALTGLALVAYGVVGSARILAVLGLGLLVWGGVRAKSSSGRSPAGRVSSQDSARIGPHAR